MTVIARRIAAVPVRTAVDTWDAIVRLLSSPEGSGRGDLEAITSVAAGLIMDEYTQAAPIVVIPATGPRVRIYTVHGTDAVETKDDETPLAVPPVDQPGWTMSLPCGVDDLDQIKAALHPYPHIDVRDLTDGIAPTEASTSPRTTVTPKINIGEMERP